MGRADRSGADRTRTDVAGMATHSAASIRLQSEAPEQFLRRVPSGHPFFNRDLPDMHAGVGRAVGGGSKSRIALVWRTAVAGLCIGARSEEHTSELQSLMRISYAVFCLKKKNKIIKAIHLILICTHNH